MIRNFTVLASMALGSGAVQAQTQINIAEEGCYLLVALYEEPDYLRPEVATFLNGVVEGAIGQTEDAVHRFIAMVAACRDDQELTIAQALAFGRADVPLPTDAERLATLREVVEEAERERDTALRAIERLQRSDDYVPPTDEAQLADARAHLIELDQRRETLVSIIANLESIIELKAAE